jgi:tetratricopeptide (TPR) repeat protein
VTLVLVPMASVGGERDAEQRGLLGLLATRLRAMRNLTLVIDAAGCDTAGAGHALRLHRRLTPSSDLSAFELQDCTTGNRRQETFVSPRSARRDWSAAASWWVGQQLGLTMRMPSSSKALGEQAMGQYLGALGHLQRRTGPDVAAARRLLLALVEQEPEFAAGHAELAIAELLASEYGLQSADTAIARAEVAIDTALALDADLGLAHAASGLSLMVAGRYREALPVLMHAHSLEPGHDGILLWLGNAHLYSGQPLQALPWLQTVVDVNPGLVAAHISIAEAHCYAGHDEQCHEALSRAPGTPMRDYVGALLAAHEGKYAEVIAQLKSDAPAVSAEWVDSLLGQSCRALGQSDCQVALATADDPMSPESIEADLWQLDLGLATALRQAHSDVAIAEALRAEVARLQQGGVRLPVLAALIDCLEGVGNPDPALRRLLGCEPPLL